ncbi:MAG TPA: RDD family protein, partial [Candidatus Limnocylindrales bacterium]|nr:RDD family protein [Candidatus Limnocylindrales bacterium]
MPVQQEIAPGLVFASTGARFVAYIVDGFLLAVIGIIIGSILGAFGLETIRSQPPLGPSGVPDYSAYFAPDPVGSLVGVAVSALYFIGSWTGGRRATLGQRLLAIQVGNAFDGRALT